MSASGAFTLGKEERICSRKLIERLFRGGGSRAMSAFPIRMVYLVDDRQGGEELQAKMLVSVPKRCFKRAVKRNRVKRQVREAYRKNKHLLLDRMAGVQEKTVAVAFIWLDDKLYDTASVERQVQNLLTRLGEKLWKD